MGYANAPFVFPTKEKLDELKRRYPSGTRIQLIVMDDPYAPVSPGMTGTVDTVDDAGTIHMIWDDGRTLGLVAGHDRFMVLPADRT